MAAKAKRYTESAKMVDRAKLYTPQEAMELLKKTAKAEFDETIDCAVRLGVDPKHGDQMVRGTSNLPHGTGKKRRVAVIAKGDKAKEAQDSGAVRVGAEDVIEDIEKGWRDFDVLVATPDMMKSVGKLGRLLGPRMPNAKSGTVTMDIGKTVKDIASASRVEFRVEKAGIVHLAIGKASFETNQLLENLQTLVADLIKYKPAGAKGRYLRSITVSSTMGPGISIDTTEAAALAGK
jgi:large subunit ribosomal protein L1